VVHQEAGYIDAALFFSSASRDTPSLPRRLGPYIILCSFRGAQPLRTTPPGAARTSGVIRFDDHEQLFAHRPRLTQTSLPTYSFTSVGNYGLAFLLLVSPPSLPADSFTRAGRCDRLPFDMLESSPSVPAYPVTSVTSGHDICRRNR
jgi:hypothetical protein